MALSDKSFDSVTVYNLGQITEEQAKRIALETNETKFQSDKDKLLGILNELQSSFDLADLKETLPFSDLDWSLSLDSAQTESPDYSILDESDESDDVEDIISEQSNNLRKGILIDFSVEDYNICFELIRVLKKHNEDIGKILINALIDVKKELGIEDEKN